MTAILVLGLGNPILGDDGLGPRAIEEIAAAVELPEGTRVYDGGTGGLDLLGEIEEAERLIAVDAVMTGGRPGALHRLAGPDIPAYLERSASAHDVGLRDLLALARLRGSGPSEVVVLGLEPAEMVPSTSLSPAVEAALPLLLAAVRDEAWRLAAAR
ncbi:MAG TPA: hydrogenase maturation protease [Planctomycetota bacterium]|nr:hydrogenase maturation protease [Planctomycetota bacterium]